MGQYSAQSQTLAGIYAEAIAPLVTETGEKDMFLDQMRQVSAMISEQPELAQWLDNPAIDRQKRSDTATKAFGGRVCDLLRDIICIMARRSRVELLPEVTDELEKLLLAQSGVRTVTVITATAMDDLTRKLVQARVQGKYGQDARIEERIDPTIIGGLVIRCGDDVTDLSLKRDFQALTRRISSTGTDNDETADTDG